MCFGVRVVGHGVRVCRLKIASTEAFCPQDTVPQCHGTANHDDGNHRVTVPQYHGTANHDSGTTKLQTVNGATPHDHNTSIPRNLSSCSLIFRFDVGILESYGTTCPRICGTTMAYSWSLKRVVDFRPDQTKTRKPKKLIAEIVGYPGNCRKINKTQKYQKKSKVEKIPKHKTPKRKIFLYPNFSPNQDETPIDKQRPIKKLKLIINSNQQQHKEIYNNRNNIKAIL